MSSSRHECQNEVENNEPLTAVDLDGSEVETESIDTVIAEVVPSANTKSAAVDTDSALAKDGMFANQARFVARRPWLCFLTAFIIASALSVVGLIVGDFTVEADMAGWRTRGTLISNRHQQVILVRYNRKRLFSGDEEAWDDLVNNVQRSWEAGDFGRRLSRSVHLRHPPRAFAAAKDTTRWLQDESYNSTGLEGCDISWYTSSDMVEEYRLWPVWKTKGDTSALDPQAIRDICLAEEATQAALLADGLCYGCPNGRCLPPYSLVLLARLTVQDMSFSLTCDELSAAFATRTDEVEAKLQDCVDDIKVDYKEGEVLPDSCPFGFSPTLVDESFGSDSSVIRYTSSIFATYDDTEELYEKVSEFDRAEWSSVIEGAYDTQYEDFVYFKIDESLMNDAILALASAVIVAVAMVVHTRSPFITGVGLLQIILSFPLAYLVYKLIARLEFFPFLNFIGLFVVFALGADDVFVAVDKWKNARLEHRSATTEDIAAIALPDAASAMFLTTVTTAVAFFATAICKVAPLKAFAIFCGLLVTFDYIMCVFLVFPALCIYDRSLIRGSKNCCVSCHCCHRLEAHGDGPDGEDERPSFIRRVLLAYYKVIHFSRWGLLLACVAGFIVTAIYASRLALPTSSDVRLLDPDTSQYEKNYEWRLNLLSEVLLMRSGSKGYVIWGVAAADTGNHLDPDSWTQLVLDESFDPSSEAAQEYLAGFCDMFYSTEFGSKASDDYDCPINAFDSWLQDQSRSESPSIAYVSNCGGAAGLPVPQENFDSCIIAWSKVVNEKNVLQRDGKVKILVNRFQSRVRYDSPYDALDREWNALESWMNEQRSIAPVAVSSMYFSSVDFWWYDTNSDMLRTAYAAAAIALAAAAIVILLSSRSVVLTIFAVFTIAFILTSVTSLLVASGWTLGFLEAICFAIAIGISCDFVIHFAHAYSTPEADVCRMERTKYALIRMGPSILAASFTTICSASVMIFTTITFFQKFAIILFFTILMATIGAFVVFTVLTDTIGPTHPTFLTDRIIAKAMSCRCYKRFKKAGPESTERSSSSVVETPEKGGRASLCSDIACSMKSAEMNGDGQSTL